MSITMFILFSIEMIQIANYGRKAHYSETVNMIETILFILANMFSIQRFFDAEKDILPGVF